MNREPAAQNQRWHLTSLLLLGISALLALLYLFSPPKPPAPIPPALSPNAFNELMAAAGAISGTRPDLIRNDPAEIAAYVAANRMALQGIFEALAKPCEAPPDLMNMVRHRNRGGDRGQLQNVWSLFIQVLMDAEFRGDRDTALQAATGLLALGRIVPEHGTFLDHLMVWSFENTAFRHLAMWRNEFDADQCRTILARLHELEKSRPGFEVMKRWDAYYSRLMTRDLRNFEGNDGFEWKEFLQTHAPGGAYWKDWDADAERLRRVHDQRVAEAGLLKLELALRIHVLQRGVPPSRLHDLVPSIIPALPNDPFASSGFVYRISGTNWLLYSIGPDRVDDGGSPLIPPSLHGVPKGDIIFTNRPNRAVAP